MNFFKIQIWRESGSFWHKAPEFQFIIIPTSKLPSIPFAVNIPYLFFFRLSFFLPKEERKDEACLGQLISFPKHILFPRLKITQNRKLLSLFLNTHSRVFNLSSQLLLILFSISINVADLVNPISIFGNSWSYSLPI